MGWWSCTIMGGDTPYDARADMYDACGVSGDDIYDELKTPEEITKLVQANVPAMIEVALNDNDSWYPGVYRQVLGVMVMLHGCDPHEMPVGRALAIAKEGAEADDWDSDERREYIVDFIKMLENYDGTPQEPKSEGLFEKVFEAIDEGKEGLVNKQYS